MTAERITAAAVLRQDGTPCHFPPPARHHTCIHHLADVEQEPTPILGNHEPEPFTGRVMLTDLYLSGKRVEFDHQPIERGVAYKVRYERTPA